MTPDTVRLTPREIAVLRQAAAGLTNRAIGHRLRISPATVSKHLENAYRKLGATDRLTAVLRALQQGLI